ncbi:MAG: acyl-CoA dehydrogenase family protein [Jatrophihabitantaceae bacterium]
MAHSQTTGQVIEAVAELAGRIRDRGLEIEQAGRVPPDIVAGLHQAGVFRLWLPAELGGFEADPADVVTVVQALAEADGSTGWCAATGVASNVAGGLLPEPGARQVFRTGAELCGGALMPGGRAVRQPDGSFVVDGQWSFGSGTLHCDWIIGGAVVVDGAAPAGSAPAARAVVMPRAQIEFLDNWQVLGLSGTGSVDYRATGITVPAEHTVDLANMVAWPAGAMWQIPLRSLLYPILGAVPLGIGRRAIAELTELASARTRYGSARRLADRDVLQAELARAHALVGSGQAYLAASLHRLRELADRGLVPGAGDRAMARLAAVHATEQAITAVQLCFRAAGTAGIASTSALQRALRDVHTAGQHYALSGPGYELAGRVLLGFDPDPML